MAEAFKAPLPPFVDLDTGCTVVFEAVDPTSGAPVTGVLISDALLRVEYSGPGDQPLTVVEPPLLTYDTQA